MTSLRELAFPSAEQMPARPGHRGRKFDIKTELSPQQAGKIREDTGAVPSGPVKGCASMNTSADCARHPPDPAAVPPDFQPVVTVDPACRVPLGPCTAIFTLSFLSFESINMPVSPARASSTGLCTSNTTGPSCQSSFLEK